MQRERQHLPNYNTNDHPSINQISHSSSNQPSVNQNENIQRNLFQTYSSNHHNINPSVPYAATSAGQISNSSQTNVQSNNDLRFSHQRIEDSRAYSKYSTREHPNSSNNHSNMNDLMKITDQVLNNQIKFSSSERTERRDFPPSENSHQNTPLGHYSSSSVTPYSDKKRSDSKCQAASADKAQMICYKCGALVERTSAITDDVATIAACHKCNEILYFVADGKTAKDESSSSEKIIPNQNSHTTSSYDLTEKIDTR